MKRIFALVALLSIASQANAAVVIVRPVIIPRAPVVVVPRTSANKPAATKPREVYHYTPTPVNPAIYPYLFWSERGECYDEKTKKHFKCGKDAKKKENE